MAATSLTAAANGAPAQVVEADQRQIGVDPGYGKVGGEHDAALRRP